MEKDLVGDRLALEVPQGGFTASLIWGMVRDLMETAGASDSEWSRSEEAVRNAVEAVIGSSNEAPGPLKALFEITSEGIDITLGGPAATRKVSVRDT